MSGSTLSSKDAVDPLIHKGYLGELAAAYLSAGFDRKDPRVSPLYADLRGFPPTLIQVGSDETLLSDATRFAAAAGVADVAVTLEIWPRMNSRMASLERPPGGRPPRDRHGRCIHARPPLRKAGLSRYVATRPPRSARTAANVRANVCASPGQRAET